MNAAGNRTKMVSDKRIVHFADDYREIFSAYFRKHISPTLNFKPETINSFYAGR